MKDAKRRLEATEVGDDPVLWAIACGLKPQKWQARALWLATAGLLPETAKKNGIQEVKNELAVVAANGAGKSWVVCVLVAYWLWRVRKGAVVVTSASWRQLRAQISAGIRSMFGSVFPQWEFLDNRIDNPVNGAVCHFLSVDTPGRFEGIHSRREAGDDGVMVGGLLQVFDEAKTIPNSVEAAAQRSKALSKVVVSSPAGLPSGFHYDMFHNPQRMALAYQLKVTAFDVDSPDLDQIEKIETLHGKESVQYRSQILAEWTASERKGVVVNAVHLAKMIQNPPKDTQSWETRSQWRAFVDLSWTAGGDRTAVAIRRGKHIHLAAVWEGRDNAQQVVRDVVAVLYKHGVPRGATYIDSAGGGKLFQEMFKNAGCEVVGWNSCGKPSRADIYRDAGAEAWGQFGERVTAGFNEPDKGWKLTAERPEWLEELKAEICGRTWADRDSTIGGATTLALSPKATDFPSSSPDLADAVVGASVDHLNLVDHPCFRTDAELGWEEMRLNRELESEGLEGMWAGA